MRALWDSARANRMCVLHTTRTQSGSFRAAAGGVRSCEPPEHSHLAVTSDISCVRTAVSPTRCRSPHRCQAAALRDWHDPGAKDFYNLQMRFGKARGLQAENKRHVYGIQQNRKEKVSALCERGLITCLDVMVVCSSAASGI